MKRSLKGGASALLALLALALVSPSSAAAAATITVINGDPPGQGFNDPTPAAPVGGNSGTTRGEQRLIAVQHAANIWGGLVNSAVEIRVWSRYFNNCVFLGFASVGSVARDFVGAPVPNTWYPIALANALAGVDLCPVGGSCSTTDDMNVLFGGGCGFYLGLDGTPSGSSDLVSVALHEIGHGLGFTTPVNRFTGEKFMGYDDAYMRHLEDHRTGKQFPEMTDGERAAAVIATGNLHWVGEEVVAASDSLTQGADPNGHVLMYAPDPVQVGSSVSHFDPTLFPNQVLEAFYAGVIHDAGLALPLMHDIGWPLVLRNRYTCYQGTDLKNPKFEDISVTTSDQISSEVVEAQKPKLVCVPSSTDGAGIGDPDALLVCYQIKGSELIPQPQVEVVTQFQLSRFSLRKPKLLCLPATLSPLP